QTQRSDVAATHVLTTALLDAALLTLKNNKAQKLSERVDGSTAVGTTPIRQSYVALVHTNLAAKVKALTGFVGVEKYPSQTDVMPGEFGYYNEIRFIESTNGAVFAGEGANGIDVYSVVILGKNAYGTTRISGEAVQNIRHAPGTSGTADPLNQRGTSGWKATFAGMILNNDFMTRIEVALT